MVNDYNTHCTPSTTPLRLHGVSGPAPLIAEGRVRPGALQKSSSLCKEISCETMHHVSLPAFIATSERLARLMQLAFKRHVTHVRIIQISFSRRQKK